MNPVTPQTLYYGLSVDLWLRIIPICLSVLGVGAVVPRLYGVYVENKKRERKKGWVEEGIRLEKRKRDIPTLLSIISECRNLERLNQIYAEIIERQTSVTDASPTGQRMAESIERVRIGFNRFVNPSEHPLNLFLQQVKPMEVQTVIALREAAENLFAAIEKDSDDHIRRTP